MLSWQLSLNVRRKACEFRLYNYRERHTRVVGERASHPLMGEMWRKKDDVLAYLRWQISRELDEIKFVRMMANVGPIVGNKMVLHVRDGKTHRVRPGPSIIDLIQREADKAKQAADEYAKANDWTALCKAGGKHAGLELALQILAAPYKYLDEDERAAYDLAEQHEKQVIENRAGGRPESMASSPVAQTKPTLAQARAQQSSQVVRRGANG